MPVSVDPSLWPCQKVLGGTKERLFAGALTPEAAREGACLACLLGRLGKLLHRWSQCQVTTSECCHQKRSGIGCPGNERGPSANAGKTEAEGGSDSLTETEPHTEMKQERVKSEQAEHSRRRGDSFWEIDLN